MVLLVNDLKFEKLVCSTTIVCISENGKIEDLEDVKDEIESGFNDVLCDVMNTHNCVVKFEISDCILLSDGDCKDKKN